MLKSDNINGKFLIIELTEKLMAILILKQKFRYISLSFNFRNILFKKYGTLDIYFQNRPHVTECIVIILLVWTSNVE